MEGDEVGDFLLILGVWLAFGVSAAVVYPLGYKTKPELRKLAFERSVTLAFGAGFLAPVLPVASSYGAFEPVVAILAAVICAFIGAHFLATADASRLKRDRYVEDLARRLDELEHEFRWLRNRGA